MTAAPAETCPVPSVRDAWQMWRNTKKVSKLDTMRWQAKLPAHSCDFESHNHILDRRERLYGKAIYKERSCQNPGDQYCNAGHSPQQWTDFLCSVCAKRLRLFHRREPSGVHRKIHASGEAGGKVCHIPQSAQRRSVSRSVSLPE